ncbi:hypothetical protein [Streptomyces litchfieldiae]|uniref:Uncharacterized protein n=1 Tax=Streptomyces litchfieldiae TaxID=3075543 RepID=A0ABU2MIT7_9ACTN|nr:hypothetical protein [Streptomyces sp. DSM 44938]MDT0341293.1 hypothetical protein [Streptomyces sp. DSM 44938]
MSAPEPTTLDLAPRGRVPSEPRTIALIPPRPRPPGPGGPVPARPAPDQPPLPTPDLATLPEAGWRDDTGTPFALTPARFGIHLGTARDGRPVALPCPRPEAICIAVLGEPLFGRLVALRLLATGAMVTAATREPGPWRGIRHAAGEQLAFTDDPAAWPRHTPAPPGVDAGPQALVSDQRRPPPAAVTAGPWRTVLHVAPSLPRGSAFWRRPHVLLALGAEHAEAIGRLLGPEAARLTSGLAPGEIVLFRPTATEILRPDIAPGENALLTPGAPPLR